MNALALGADAVLLGRATLFGLAAGGEAGVRRALNILTDEAARATALLGCGAVENLNSEYLSPVSAKSSSSFRLPGNSDDANFSNVRIIGNASQVGPLLPQTELVIATSCHVVLPDDLELGKQIASPKRLDTACIVPYNCLRGLRMCIGVEPTLIRHPPYLAEGPTDTLQMRFKMLSNDVNELPCRVEGDAPMGRVRHV